MTPRPTRRSPPPLPDLHCRHFGTCGACDRLDVPIEAQIGEKVAMLEHQLRPFLGEVRVDCAIPRRTPRHHRTRLLYPARPDRQGQAMLGHFAYRSHDVVRITECQTQDPGLTALGSAAERILRELRLPAFDPASGRGLVKAIQARLAQGTGELLTSVVTTPGPFPQGPELAARLMAAARTLPRASGALPTLPVGVVRSISERGDEFLLGSEHQTLHGRDHLVDQADGLQFRISAGSFYQIHRDASALLYRPALSMCGDLRGQRVVDGYGGIGTFGLRAARDGAASVAIVEDNHAACGDALHNAERNALSMVTVTEARFHEADFAPAPDLLIVDPPRSGLQAHGVARVLAARPQRLLHIACSADSLALDLAGLQAGGYRVQAMRLCDLFPHTGHVEVAALLSRAAP